MEPVVHDSGERLDVFSQTGIRIEEISLITEDPDALAALEVLHGKGYTSDEVKQAYDEPVPVPVTKVRHCQAMRTSLDTRVRTESGRILGKHDL